MAGKLNRDIPETEATAHVETKPTDLADKGHVAEASQQEEQITRENLARQRSIYLKRAKREKSVKHAHQGYGRQ